MSRQFLSLLILVAGLACHGRAETQVIVDAERGEAATRDHRFETVPPPSALDAGNRAETTVVSGRPDPNGASVECLVDGQVPAHQDDPSANFFFFGSTGGRLLLDLGEPTEIQQINSYSWHPDVRGPQVYRVYAASEATNLNLEPRGVADLSSAGWTRLAEVDTRPDGKPMGGQYGVSIRDASGNALGRFRYVLLDISATEADRLMSHTFYSEIDIVDGKQHPLPKTTQHVETLHIGDDYEILFDTTEMPEIRPWVDARLKPICAEWYPKIVTLLPSEDFTAPQQFKIVFHKDMRGVANTSGTQINCAGPWFMRNLNGEAAGAVVHEMVHVVQQYSRRRGSRNPGWMVEGIADYIRWFLYEPAEQRPRPNPARSNYDDSYRTSAAFLNYVASQHGEDLIEKFNTAMRRGKYDDRLWVEFTGKTPSELWEEFVKTL